MASPEQRNSLSSGWAAIIRIFIGKCLLIFVFDKIIIEWEKPRVNGENRPQSAFFALYKFLRIYYNIFCMGVEKDGPAQPLPREPGHGESPAGGAAPDHFGASG